MNKTIINTKSVGLSRYVDISNSVKEVKHSVVFDDAEKREREEQIVEELYRIFTHKEG